MLMLKGDKFFPLSLYEIFLSQVQLQEFWNLTMKTKLASSKSEFFCKHF